MLLMSWAGEQARKDLMLAMGRDLAAEMSAAVTKMMDCGVEHRDVRPPNVLWNPEIKNVVLVDFERSEILKQVQVLEETSPNRKRKHLHFYSGASRRRPKAWLGNDGEAMKDDISHHCRQEEKSM
jgi:serine/threonine protein kinase